MLKESTDRRGHAPAKTAELFTNTSAVSRCGVDRETELFKSFDL